MVGLIHAPLSWLGPERERVSIFKYGTVEAVVKALQYRCALISTCTDPVCVALRAFDEAHKPRQP